MRLNRKGFTVIESVITFMIIAIAGSMLILGIFNIVNIFTESSVIKSETNRLYNELVNESDTVKKGTDKDMTFVFSDNSKSIATFKDCFVDVESPIKIKLFSFDPEKKAKMLPGEVQQPEEPEITGKRGQFMYLTNPQALTYDQVSFSKHGTNPDNYTVNEIIDDLLRTELDDVDAFHIYGENVKNYLLNKPSNSQFQNAFNLLPDSYKNAMGLTTMEDSRLIYNGIVKSAMPNDIPMILTQFVPNRPGLLLKYTPKGHVNNYTFVWCDIVKNGDKYILDLPINIGDMANNHFTITLNNGEKVVLNLGQLKNCDFIKSTPDDPSGAVLINGHYYAEAL